jgi:hypothetical protein
LLASQSNIHVQARHFSLVKNFVKTWLFDVFAFSEEFLQTISRDIDPVDQCNQLDRRITIECSLDQEVTQQDNLGQNGGHAKAGQASKNI